MNCPNCGEAGEDGATFCEACGTTLDAAAAAAVTAGKPVNPAVECPQCHAGPGCIDEEGFCTSCGTKRKPGPRDHFHQVVSARLAGVSDIGMKYSENQDCLALGEGVGGLVMVVCDGVSTSQNPLIGSRLASETARDVLVAGSARQDLEALFAEVAEAAQQAICKTPFQAGATNARGVELMPAQSTMVAVLVQGRKASVGWIGDSRAYWVPVSGKCRQLTVDHSWYQWAVNEGGMTAEAASADPRSHSIIRSLGADDAGNYAPVDCEMRTLNITDRGRLVVCSDGLWNYLKDEAHLLELVSSCGDKADALSIARKLVNFAREAGGHDNITAVVAELA